MSNHRRALTEARSKLLLERQLLRSLQRHLSRLSVLFSRQPDAFNPDLERENLERILLRAYSRSANVFTDFVRIKGLNQETIQTVTEYFRDSVIGRVQQIHNTIVNDSVDILSAVDSDDTITTDVARNRVAARRLRNRMRTRFATVAATETQFSAEVTKRTKAELAAGVEPSVISRTNRAIDATKEWVSIGDHRVRGAHLAADGQVVSITEPFIVGGEQLMSPGDPDLGASVGNLVNCRCASIYNEREIRKL